MALAPALETGAAQSEDPSLKDFLRSSESIPNFPSTQEVLLASWAKDQSGPVSTAMKAMLEQAQDPQMRYLAGGLPAPEVFPSREKTVEFVDTACTRYGIKDFFQYGEPGGMRQFREVLASFAEQQGFKPPKNSTMMDAIMVGIGSQQLLKFVGEAFGDRGDPVVVESPTYLGAIQAWKGRHFNYIPVRTNFSGTDPEDLENIFRTYRVKFYYANHRYSNPAGTTTPAENLERIAWLGEKYGVPIVEDGPYDLLNFTGEIIPSLQELNQKGVVVRLNTWSKYLAPGLRLGWTIAPPEVVEKFINIQQGDAMFASTFCQAFAAVCLTDGFFEEQLPKTVALYKARNEEMGKALAREMPKGVTWTEATGGMFRWIVLPEGMNASTMLPAALKKKVAYVPGAAFYAVNPKPNTFRVCFSNSSPEGIRGGIHDLAPVIEEEMDRLHLHQSVDVYTG